MGERERKKDSEITFERGIDRGGSSKKKER